MKPLYSQIEFDSTDLLALECYECSGVFKRPKIDLCIINTSQQKYINPSTSKKYLDIIVNIIDERL